MKLLRAIAVVLPLVMAMMSPAQAETLNAHYLLTANNWHGDLELQINGQTVSGKMTLHASRAGKTSGKVEAIKGKVIAQDGRTLMIRFERVGQGQVYTGWFSVDREIVAGSFEKGYQQPWFGTRVY